MLHVGTPGITVRAHAVGASVPRVGSYPVCIGTYQVPEVTCDCCEQVFVFKPTQMPGGRRRPHIPVPGTYGYKHTVEKKIVNTSGVPENISNADTSSSIDTNGYQGKLAMLILAVIVILIAAIHLYKLPGYAYRICSEANAGTNRNHKLAFRPRCVSQADWRNTTI